MTSFAPILRRIALVLTALFAVGGSLFALGYAWEDLPVWPALLMTLAVVVPMAGLSRLAARKPEPALKLLAALVGLFGVYAIVGVFVDFFEAPDLPVMALVLALPIAVLGLRKPLHAGLLLIALAVFPLVQVVARMLGEPGPEGPGLGALLGGSTGVVIIPLTVLGLLFLAGHGGDHEGAAGPASAAPPQEVAHH